MDERTMLGEWELTKLRARVRDTKPGTITIGNMALPVPGGLNIPYVCMEGPQLTGLLDELLAARESPKGG